ncbi:S-protein homolog 19-like [Coffea eugenioides]|uniref:S-protein homolog n=1 Tax=Coffea arabica TaxID=13443 RepID=A0ABM4UYY9_COFAR|nr:S-protein homolog 19-like [Coffea eugenioides]
MGIKFLFIFLVFSILPSEARVIAVDRYVYSVHIIDNLPYNVPLVIHCKSSDRDRGNETLKFSDDYNWEFFMGDGQRVSYSCHFWWLKGRKQKELVVFDVDLIKNYCVESSHACGWVVKEDGFYLYSKRGGGPFYKMADWDIKESV